MNCTRWLTAALSIMTVILPFCFTACGRITWEEDAASRETPELHTAASARVDLGGFTTELTDHDSRVHVMKIGIVLSISRSRIDCDSAVREIESRKSELIEAAMIAVSEKITPAMLKGDAPHRRAGYDELRATILRALNERLEHKADEVEIPEYSLSEK